MIYLQTYKLYENSKQCSFLIKKITYALLSSEEYTYSSSEKFEYSTSDLELDVDPVFDEDENTITLINSFDETGVYYRTMKKYDDVEELHGGYSEYIELKCDLLEEIWLIIKKSIRHDLIHLNFDIKNKEQYDRLIFILSIDGERDKEKYPDKYEDYLIYKDLNKFNI